MIIDNHFLNEIANHFSLRVRLANQRTFSVPIRVVLAGERREGGTIPPGEGVDLEKPAPYVHVPRSNLCIKITCSEWITTLHVATRVIVANRYIGMKKKKS